MKLWVQQNWNKWEEEKPEWLTDARKAKNPVEWMDTNSSSRQRESERRASVRGGSGRRPSLLESMTGSLDKYLLSLVTMSQQVRNKEGVKDFNSIGIKLIYY